MNGKIFKEYTYGAETRDLLGEDLRSEWYGVEKQGAARCAELDGTIGQYHNTP